MKELRFHMDAGDVEQALVLDRELCELYSELEDAVDPRTLGTSDTVYISHADFFVGQSSLLGMIKSLKERSRIPSDYYPEGVNLGLMVEIRKIRLEIHAAIKQEVDDADEEGNEHAHDNDINHFDQRNIDMAEGNERDEYNDDESYDHEDIEHGDEENDDENDDENENEDDIWTAIEETVRSSMTQFRNKTIQELKLPREASAPIARYSHDAHFLFHSEQAQASCGKLIDALVTCQLRNRPTSFTCDKRARTPFEYRTPAGVNGFDLDGDMIAMCGDLRDNEMFSQPMGISLKAT